MLCSKPPLEGSGVLVSESGHGLLSLFSSMPGSEVPEDFEKNECVCVWGGTFLYKESLGTFFGDTNLCRIF